MLVLLLDDSAVLVELLNGIVTPLGCHGIGFKRVCRFSFLAKLLLIGSTLLVLLLISVTKIASDICP